MVDNPIPNLAFLIYSCGTRKNFINYPMRFVGRTSWEVGEEDDDAHARTPLKKHPPLDSYGERGGAFSAQT